MPPMQYFGMTTTAAALTLFITSSTWAETNQSQISEEQLLVTGTRIVGSATSLAGHTTIVTREQIEASASASALDLLRGIEGLHVSQNGGRGGVASVFIQGAEPNFTLVMIDGVKVNDPNNSRGGSFNFSTLNLSEVERIEIARGAVSSIYGSDGLAGVINIITRIATDTPQLSASVEAGEDEFLRNTLTFSAPINEHHAFSFGVSTADDGDAVDGNEFDNTAAHAKWRRSGEFAFDVSARYAQSDAESFPEDSGGSELAVIRELDDKEHEQLNLAANLNYQYNETWQFNGQTTYLDLDEEQRSPGVAPGIRAPVPPNNSDASLQRLNVSAHTLFSPNEAITLTAGADYQDEDGEQSGSVELFPGFSLPTDFELDREIVGVFAEGQWQLPTGFTLSAAIRRDDPSNESAETTARLGAQYTTATTRWYATWGQGYKLPSFFALGHGLVGNPNLEPETSTNWSVGVDQKLGNNASVSVSAFLNEFEDLIDFDFDAFTNVNRDKVDTQGFEVAASVDLNDSTRATAHLTYVDIDVKSTGSKLRQRPDWRGGANLLWAPIENLDLNLSWLYVGDVFDSSIPTGAMTLDSYNRVDLNVAWTPTQRLRLWLAIDNVSDEVYEEAIGFRSAGIRTRVGARVQF